MTNVGLFVTLLVVIQSVFFIADGWTAYVERTRAWRQVIRLSTFVLAMALLYFAVQLALSAALPDFHRLMTMLAAFAGIGHDPNAATPGPAAMMLLLPAGLVTATLFDYLVHRFVLHGVLFVLHENHHLPTIVSNLMPGIAARPFVVVPNFLINAASLLVLLMLIRLVGRPDLVGALDALPLPLALVFAFIACASHSAFLRRFDFVETIFRSLAIVTPREHLVHHAAGIDANYGNFTTVWDRLFGTYVSPSAPPLSLGLPYDQDFLGSLTGGLLKLPARAREYFAIDAVCRIGHNVRNQTTQT